jgi:hypothetical protein
MHRESVLRSDETKLLEYAYKVKSDRTLADGHTPSCQTRPLLMLRAIIPTPDALRSNFSGSIGFTRLGGKRGDQARVSGQGFSEGVEETTCPSRISKVRGCPGFGLPGV